MPGDIEEWAARHRVAAAARNVREALRRLSNDRAELEDAIQDARRAGVCDQDIADAGRLEPVR